MKDTQTLDMFASAVTENEIKDISYNGIFNEDGTLSEENKGFCFPILSFTVDTFMGDLFVSLGGMSNDFVRLEMRGSLASGYGYLNKFLVYRDYMKQNKETFLDVAIDYVKIRIARTYKKLTGAV
jgi:hypothetical protein